MKLNTTSVPAINAYDKGFKLGISSSLKDEKLDLKQIKNPYHKIFSRVQFDGFVGGIKDGYLQGIKQRENHRAYARLKQLDRTKKNDRELER